MNLRPLLLAPCFFLLPLSLFAFDSAKWMAKREAMTDDAVRLMAAYSNCVAEVKTPSEEVTIPMETYPDGSVRTSVYAKRAQFFEKSPLVWAEDMVLTKLDDDGVEKLRLEARHCVIDRFERSGWIDGHARLIQGKTVFEGDGVYFSASNNFVTVYSDSDVKSADLKFGGLR